MLGKVQSGVVPRSNKLRERKEERKIKRQFLSVAFSWKPSQQHVNRTWNKYICKDRVALPKIEKKLIWCHKAGRRGRQISQMWNTLDRSPTCQTYPETCCYCCTNIYLHIYMLFQSVGFSFFCCLWRFHREGPFYTTCNYNLHLPYNLLFCMPIPIITHVYYFHKYLMVCHSQWL